MATRAEKIARLRRLIGKHDRRIARAFMRSVRKVRDLNTLDEIIDATRIGPAAVLALFDSRRMDTAFNELASAIAEATVEGARTTAGLLDPVEGPDGGTVEFVFNVANPALAQYAERNTARRVREVSASVRQTIVEIVRDGAVRGDNPITTARRLRDDIGLTRRQWRAVRNFDRLLQDGDPQALDRALRDRRYDSRLRALVRGERDLTDEQRLRMVDRYRERFVKYRAETIARTESTRAVSGGSQVYLEQQVREGVIDPRQIRREWIYTRDSKTRDAHVQVPSMNPDGVALTERFMTPLGALRFPGDPDGAAENTINCRCTVFPRVLSPTLAGLN